MDSSTNTDQGSCRYEALVYCRDCLNEDSLGCFDGDYEPIGVFADYGEAETAARKVASDCPLWEYQINAIS